MKRLTLIRHAQAEDAVGGQADFDRVLTRRGSGDAAEMARRLKQCKFPLPLVVSSTAARALATAEFFVQSLRVPIDLYRRDDRLYTAGPAEYLKVLREYESDHQHVIIIAHNPGITETADKLCSERAIDALPTGSIITMVFKLTRWCDLQWHSGCDAELDYPARPS